MASASGRPEEDASLVPGFGCSGVFGGPAGLRFVFGPWDGSAGCRSSLVLGSGFGAVRRSRSVVVVSCGVVI